MKKNIVEKKEVINSKNKNALIEDDCEVNINNGNIASLIPKLPNDEEFTILADFFSVFSDSTRLKIISALSEKELCVHELSSLLKMKQPSISQHLKTFSLNAEMIFNLVESENTEKKSARIVNSSSFGSLGIKEAIFPLLILTSQSSSINAFLFLELITSFFSTIFFFIISTFYFLYITIL